MSEAKMAVPFVARDPDPEVPTKAQRRKFRAEDKKRILEEVDRAAGPGGIGAVLRREGIYSSTLHSWRERLSATSTLRASSRFWISPTVSMRYTAGCSRTLRHW